MLPDHHVLMLELSAFLMLLGMTRTVRRRRERFKDEHRGRTTEGQARRRRRLPQIVRSGEGGTRQRARQSSRAGNVSRRILTPRALVSPTPKLGP